MKTITINIWSKVADLGTPVEKLVAAGVGSARLASPFKASTTKPVWAIQYDFDDSVQSDAVGVVLNIGWALGVIGVEKNVIIDYMVSDYVEDIKI